MLKPAAMKTAPKNATHNTCQGIQFGKSEPRVDPSLDANGDDREREYGGPELSSASRARSRLDLCVAIGSLISGPR